MKKVLMCSPTYFDVSYEINPWMAQQQGLVDRGLAYTQWQRLHDAIAVVAQVSVMPGVDQLPDLVFTANAGLVCNGIAVLSRFAKPERQPEEQYFDAWFADNDYPVVQPVNDYEGEGDHLVDAYGRHWVGTGFRSSAAAVPELEDFLATKITALELVDPRWYHLDTCFCPLPAGELLWYPPAFSQASQDTIRASFTVRVEVTEADALAFCCNSVCIDRNIFMPESDYANSQVGSLGYTVETFNLSEFLRAGGAAKCLVLHC